MPEKDKRWKYESKKVKRLLFRLVNLYPAGHRLWMPARLPLLSLYLKAGKEGADYTAASDLSELFLESGVPVDFLYLHDYRHPGFCGGGLPHLCLPVPVEMSVFVIEGIRYTSADVCPLETYASRTGGRVLRSTFMTLVSYSSIKLR